MSISGKLSHVEKIQLKELVLPLLEKIRPKGWYMWDGGQINILPNKQMLFIGRYKTGLGRMKYEKRYDTLTKTVFILASGIKDVKEIQDKDIDKLPSPYTMINFDF